MLAARDKAAIPKRIEGKAVKVPIALVFLCHPLNAQHFAEN